MAFPRRVIPGAMYLLTRRAYQRTYRMRPHPASNQIAEYCAAWAARRTGVVIHAFVVMSNHHHMVVTDPRGVLPEFLREFHRTMAKALNASQGQWENLWSAEKASAVRLPTLDDVIDKIAYAAANPVAAALVEAPEQWPGVNHWIPGTRREVARPEAYFDPSGAMPETVELRIAVPEGASGDSSEWRERVHAAVAAAVAKAREAVAEQGLEFMGSEAVRRKSFLQRARTYEAKWQINPVLAARDIIVRKVFIRVEKAFQVAYRAALQAWRGGDRWVTFPLGSWWMGVHHRAKVEPASG